jgi:hypothetical protein
MSKIDSQHMDKYIDGKLVKEGKKDESETLDHYWWKKSGTEMAQSVASTIKFIQKHQPTRVEQLTASTRLYGASSAFNFIGPALSRSASTSANSQSNRISFNLCSSVVDTLTAKAAKNKVIPTFITSGGDWIMQRKAEKLSKFIEGMFYEQHIHSKGTYRFRDASVWGTGVMHIFEDEKRVAAELCFPHELLVDQVEAMAGNPRQLHRVKIVDRDILLNMFDGNEEAMEAIKRAKPSTYIEVGGAGTAADLLTVTESWHLKSGKNAKDGVHVICIDDTVLTPENEREYDRDYFPFAFMHYNKRLFGFWGQGACERLQNLQQEINRNMILDQKSRWMMGSFKVLVENGSKVVSQHLNNDIGTIINYTGTPPQYITPPSIDPDNARNIDSLIAKGYQQEGVSQLAASSLKPQGLDSGAALRDFDNIADDRMLFTMQELEQFYLEIAVQMIEVAKDIYSRTGKYEVMFPGVTFARSIDWKDIDLKRDEYIMKAFPTSSLPEEPSAKLQTVQEYMQAGLISPQAGRRLLSMPDVEMSNMLANAPEDMLHRVFEEMLDEQKFRPCEPEWNLQLATQLYLQYYNYAQLHNAPEEVMSLLRQFKTSIDDLTGANKPAEPQAAPAPMANPTPAPMSPMLQNTNTPQLQ